MMITAAPMEPVEQGQATPGAATGAPITTTVAPLLARAVSPAARAGPERLVAAERHRRAARWPPQAPSRAAWAEQLAIWQLPERAAKVRSPRCRTRKSC